MGRKNSRNALVTYGEKEIYSCVLKQKHATVLLLLNKLHRRPIDPQLSLFAT